VSDSTAKLKVTVKLHQQSLTELPEPTPPKPAPLSAGRLAVAVVAILLAAYGGRWLYQQWPHNDIDYAAYAAPQDEPVTTADAQPGVAVTASVELPTQLSSPASNPNSQSVESELPTSNSAKAQLAAAQGEQPSKPQDMVAEQPAAQPLIQTSGSQASVVSSVKNSVLPTGFRRIVLTAQMERLEPGAAVAEPVPFASVKRVYLFTEIEGFAGQHLRHRWYWNNQFQYEARLTVEDSPWRTYSEKWLLDDQRGDWRVEIVDQAQNVLYQHDFTYQ
jgi:hypothetical protein